MRSLFLVLAVFLGVLPGLVAGEVKLRVLQTADIHMYLSDFDFFRNEVNANHGLVRTASLIKAVRSESENVILVDNGDLIQGNPMGDFEVERFHKNKKIVSHPLTRVMSHLKYDVGNIGNHEFNFGLPYLRKLVDTFPFPYVCANVFKTEDDETLFEPFVVLEREVVADDGSRHELKIGVIGVVPPQIMNWDKMYLRDRVHVIDMRDAVRRYLPQAKAQGADLIVVVAHAGIVSKEADSMEENAVVGITKIEGVNAVLAGHAHRVFPSAHYAHIPGADIGRGTINGVPVVMPGFWGSHLGIIDFTLERKDKRWHIKEIFVENRAVSRREGSKVIPLVEADPEIVEILKQDVQATRDWLKQPIGKLDQPLQSFFALVADSPVVQVVQDAQRWYVESMIRGTELEGYPLLSAAAPFKVGHPDYNAYVNIPAGDMSLRDTAEIYIYPNTLKVMKLNGAQIKDWLERAAGLFAQVKPNTEEPQLALSRFPAYNFDMIDGITYQIDITQPSRYDREGVLINPEASRIENLRWRSVPVRDHQEFLIATNSYRAYGGGNFPHAVAENVVMDAPDSVRDVLVRYIRAHADGLRVVPDHNWALKPIQEVKLIYYGSPSEAALEASKKLGHVKAGDTRNDRGYQEYQLSWQKWVEFPKKRSEGSHVP
jgi:2',3'-cyclic-nucleotide 2'-phosphodiesterase/3'-nucleotidase